MTRDEADAQTNPICVTSRAGPSRASRIGKWEWKKPYSTHMHKYREGRVIAISSTWGNPHVIIQLPCLPTWPAVVFPGTSDLTMVTCLSRVRVRLPIASSPPGQANSKLTYPRASSEVQNLYPRHTYFVPTSMSPLVHMSPPCLFCLAGASELTLPATCTCHRHELQAISLLCA